MTSPLSVIIDVGYHSTKCGFGGSNSPEYKFPSIYSYNKNDEIFYIGHETENNLDFEAQKFLSNDGTIKNENSFENLLNDIFHQKLNTYPSENGQSILLTCSPFISEKQKKFFYEIMFETFSTTLFKLENESVMSIFESGKTSGVVLEIGEGKSYSIGIEDGNMKKETMEILDFSGVSCSFYLYTLLTFVPNFNRNLLGTFDLDFIKSNYCYVAEDYALENEKLESMDTHEECILPDGQKFNLTSERFSVGETFFQPMIINNVDFREDEGIQFMLLNTLKKLENEKMKNSIILSGGSCNFKGFEKRLKIEMNSLCENEKKEFYKTNNSELSTWLGGSIYSSMSNFENEICVKIEDYEEFGISKFL